MTSMTLHFNGVGSHSRVFEALGSMLSRNALNPADVSIVRGNRHEDFTLLLYFSCTGVMLRRTKLHL